MIWGCKKKIVMSLNELKNLETATQLIGQVWLASTFIDPLFSGHSSIKSVASGLIASLCLFLLSFLLAKKINSKL